MTHAKQVRQRLQRIAKIVEAELPRRPAGPRTLFALLVFADDDEGHRCEYVSNGQRSDVIAAVKEWLWKVENNYGKHLEDDDPENPDVRFC